MGFKFYDGETGQNVFVKKFINDGKDDFVSDLEELDLIRWESDGGSYNPEDKKKYYEMYFDWKAFYKYKRHFQRKERIKRNKNYVTFGIKT